MYIKCQNENIIKDQTHRKKFLHYFNLGGTGCQFPEGICSKLLPVPIPTQPLNKVKPNTVQRIVIVLYMKRKLYF